MERLLYVLGAREGWEAEGKGHARREQAEKAQEDGPDSATRRLRDLPAQEGAGADNQDMNEPNM